MSLRVNFLGNICNYGYVIAKLLRRRGIEARLWFNHTEDIRYRPEAEDPELKEGYPEWITSFHLPKWRYRFFAKQTWNLLHALGDCDVIHTTQNGPLYAMLTRRPYVFTNSGVDFYQAPFARGSFESRLGALCMRMGLRRARKLLIGNPTMPLVQQAIQRLQLTNIGYLPIPIDTEKFAPYSAHKKAALRAPYDYEFVFFHPTRQFWDFKGNDRLLRAYARFVKETSKRCLLIAVRATNERGDGPKLVEALGIQQHVRWIDHLARHELIDYYNLADIVFDQFVVGAFGTGALEAWSCGTPVFIYLHDHRPWYPHNPPAVNVSTEQDIFEKLIALCEDRRQLATLATRSRAWVLENHGGDAVIDRYIALYEEVLAEK
jgi:glycosyltransferase involved in cell wall biosynthesis